MLSQSQKKLKDADVGDCVAVAVSEFDRGRGDPANLVGVILEKDSDKGKYKIGTRGGIISSWMERNSFELTSFRGLQEKDIPEKSAGIREIVREISVGTGQGFKKCNCKTGCLSKKCSCRTVSMICNSACHSGISCKNHD